jgi:hypothetical protein
VLPCMSSYLEQTTILHTNSFVKHMQPTFGEAVRGGPQSVGLIGPEKGATAPWDWPSPNWGQIGPSSEGDLLWASRVGLCSAFTKKK